MPLRARTPITYCGQVFETGELLPDEPLEYGGRLRPINAQELIARGQACDPDQCQECTCQRLGDDLRAADEDLANGDTVPAAVVFDAAAFLQAWDDAIAEDQVRGVSAHGLEPRDNAGGNGWDVLQHIDQALDLNTEREIPGDGIEKTAVDAPADGTPVELSGDTPAPTFEDLVALKKPELVKAATQAGVDATGTKAELAQRIVDAP